MTTAWGADASRYCAVDNDTPRGSSASGKALTIKASAADADRWRQATRKFHEDLRALGQRVRATEALIPPPPRGRSWSMRELLRRRLDKRRLARYQAVWEELHKELLAAREAYDERTGDLDDHVSAEMARLARERERKLERERQERARRREILVATLADPEARVWTCALRRPGRRQQFLIWMPALDGAKPFKGKTLPELLSRVTARQIQDELAKERRQYPYTPVLWGAETELVMRERPSGAQGDVETSWEELTGVRIESSPRRPSPTPRRGYGPSSNYGSDSGAGGGFGGGDYGGGGYGGGFGGGFGGGGY